MVSAPTERLASGLFAADRYAGQTAIVAGQGPVCHALAQRLSAGGARVFPAGPSGEDAGHISCDLADPASIAAAFDRVEREAAGASLLVVGAALASGDPERWREDLSLGLDAPFFWAAEFARRRVTAGEGGAVLILIESAALDARAADPATVAAAQALSNLVKTLSVEWARDGLRVNALGHGDDLESACSLGLYLLSTYGAYVTGSIVIADGPDIGPGVLI